jgi:hypothetical protein
MDELQVRLGSAQSRQKRCRYLVLAVANQDWGGPVPFGGVAEVWKRDPGCYPGADVERDEGLA